MSAASYSTDWPFNIGVTPVGQHQHHNKNVPLNVPLKAELQSPQFGDYHYHGGEYCTSPNYPSFFTYDLNCNSNSNDWLNAGCSKYVRGEVTPHSSPVHWSPHNSLLMQQATVVEAAWSYSGYNYW